MALENLSDSQKANPAFFFTECVILLFVCYSLTHTVFTLLVVGQSLFKCPAVGCDLCSDDS